MAMLCSPSTINVIILSPSTVLDVGYEDLVMTSKTHASFIITSTVTMHCTLNNTRFTHAYNLRDQRYKRKRAKWKKGQGENHLRITRQ